MRAPTPKRCSCGADSAGISPSWFGSRSSAPLRSPGCLGPRKARDLRDIFPVRRGSHRRRSAALIRKVIGWWRGFLTWATWVSKPTGWLAAVLVCWLLASCSGDPPAGGPSGGTKTFGETCQQTEDCASLLCVRLDVSGGVCSHACQNAQGCPASDNWDCLAAPGQGFSVCSCLKLSETEVCADGLDNDCDGKVDDCRVCAGSQVSNDDHEHCGACDHACRSDQQCEGGACECPLTSPDECSSTCTVVQTDPSNCGACGTVCALSQV